MRTPQRNVQKADVPIPTAPQSLQSFAYRWEGPNLFVTLDDEEYAIDKLLRIPTMSMERMNTAAGKQPALAMRWAILQAEAEAYERNLKDFQKYMASRLYIEFKNNPAILVGGKTPTDEGTKSLIELDPTYGLVREAYSNACTTNAILKFVIEAFRDRSRLIQTISGNIRTEYEQTYSGAA